MTKKKDESWKRTQRNEVNKEKGAGAIAEDRERKNRKQDKHCANVYSKIHTENTKMYTKTRKNKNVHKNKEEQKLYTKTRTKM